MGYDGDEISEPNDEDKVLEMRLRTNMYASDRRKLIAAYRQQIEGEIAERNYRENITWRRQMLGDLDFANKEIASLRAQLAKEQERTDKAQDEANEWRSAWKRESIRADEYQQIIQDFGAFHHFQAKIAAAEADKTALREIIRKVNAYRGYEWSEMGSQEERELASLMSAALAQAAEGAGADRADQAGKE